MVLRLTFRSTTLAKWLSQFATYMTGNTFKRGISLFDKHRVWDYHASDKGLHASVEDIHHTFYQVHIQWQKEDYELTGNAQRLPIPDKIEVKCECTSAHPYCAHAVAAIIYWIKRLDDTKSEHTPILSVADQGDSPAYQRLLENYKNLEQSVTPSFQRFDKQKLINRPDFQEIAEQIVKSVSANQHD
ncbi:SWIM zinc finger domain-containing protein [Sporolactobacillus kofuensis]|uniref:SWIM zinc finger domain-containing protein n=1 Tax=Sporolactobacillus kofuensis TaxID=269672 RepID=A0ABW1WGS3_9BACL|nr:hypothetical protein [Sporolactobacillus kofuensis]MCO7176077.1 hypothetical protein [Sporolactobacillus kofuensis]